MNNLNKQIALFLAVFLASSLSFSYADDKMKFSWTTDIQVEFKEENKYTESYYDFFKREFYQELLKWDFSRIDKKIEGYLLEIKYLSENPESDYYKNIYSYKEKLKALQDLKANFSSSIINKEKQQETKKEFKDKNEKFREIKDQYKGDFKDQYKGDFKENRYEYKDGMQETKKEFKDKKQELKAKYKAQFTKTLGPKIANFSTDRIKLIISRIDIAIEKYNSLEIPQDKKDKFIAQLSVLKEILQEKIYELENTIDLEELLAE